MDIIKLELPLEVVNVILATLSEAPYKVAQPIIEVIRGQAYPQTSEYQAVIKAKDAAKLEAEKARLATK